MVAEPRAEPRPPLIAFRYVDSAVGGANNRNHVCDIATFDPPAGARDVFTTYLRYPDEILTYMAAHLNDSGQPSVRGYDGLAYAPFFPFDFDSANNPAAALQEAQAFVRRLCEQYGVPANAIRPFFSGSKGCSIEVPGTLFGGFEPMNASVLVDRLKRSAMALADGLETLDTSIYDRVRLWREPNTINSKSELFKIELTVQEFQNLTFEDIKRLATRRRTIERVPDDEWSANPELVAVWEAASRPEPIRFAPPTEGIGELELSADRISQAAALLDPAYVEGHRHELAMGAAGWLGKQGYCQASVESLIERLAANDPELPDRLRTVRSTFDKIAASEQVEGWSGLKQRVPDRTLKALEILIGTEPVIVTDRHRTNGNGAMPPDHEPVAGQAPTARIPERSPELDPAALHGLAGDVVRAVDPHTEGDPVATLVNFLVMFGNAVGATPHARVGDRQHRANENAVLVGDTSKGRKGTSHDTPEQIVREAAADSAWGQRIQGGLSSGEGVIWAVRDPIIEEKKGELVTVDGGEPDKRLMLVEQEFSAVLKVAGREGNTLTEVIRQAWDGRPLQILTKNRKATCGSPHISVLAHITKTELQRELTDTNAANGFGNRFLWVCVKRSKLLPEGGALADVERSELIWRTREAIVEARKIGTVGRDEEAKRLWAEIYGDLSEPSLGLWGALTDRAEAHVLRLSLLYALLDGSRVITVDHLLAALALWDYCAASAKHIFGDSTGDPIADRILAALRANGEMDQSALSDLFGRHVNAGRLGKALEALLVAGLARSERDRENPGRPRIVWTPR